MNLTTKQLKILLQIHQGNGRDGQGNLDPIDMDELLERLDYKPSKASLQFSVRALIQHGLIYKGQNILRRGRMRVVYFPTDLGNSLATGRPHVSFVETKSDVNISTLDDFLTSAMPNKESE